MRDRRWKTAKRSALGELRRRPPLGCTLMIGDSAADILAGKAAGTTTCEALYGSGTQLEIKWSGLNLVTRSIQKFPQA